MIIQYPPEYIFPRNPDLSKYLTPIKIENEVYKEDGSGLIFDFGFTGILNVIKTKYPIYIVKKKFNFKTNQWTDNQILIRSTNELQQFIDVTPYFTNNVINFSITSIGVNDTINYYYDGEKIVTNYDFSNVEDRKRINITYYKLLNSIRVQAVLNTNNNGISFYTPVVDQYTLILDKQRIIG